FIDDHARRQRSRFGGAAVTQTVDRDATAAAILPHLRGAVSSDRRVIAHVERSDEALEFANSEWAADLCALGTSCPDHFLRTRISPMFVPWNPKAETVDDLTRRIDERLAVYRAQYAAYYAAHAGPESPRMRGSNPP